MTQPSDSNAKQAASKSSAIESSVKNDKNSDKKKERKGNTFLLILIILILGFIVTFGSIFMFNFAGLKAETSMWISNIPVVGKLLKPVVENKNPEQIAKEELDIARANNEIKLKEINEQKKELDLRAKEIESKEKELADKELQINDALQKLSDKLISVQEQVQYLEKVDNAKAMQIIMSMDDKGHSSADLKEYEKEKASAILALMDPLQAAQILEDLANEPIIQDAATKP